MIFPADARRTAGRNALETRKGPCETLTPQCHHGTEDRFRGRVKETYYDVDPEMAHQILCGLVRERFIVPSVVKPLNLVSTQTRLGSGISRQAYQHS
jgi:hypothetical protein